MRQLTAAQRTTSHVHIAQDKSRWRGRQFGLVRGSCIPYQQARDLSLSCLQGTDRYGKPWHLSCLEGKPQHTRYLLLQPQRHSTVGHLLWRARRAWLMVCPFLDPPAMCLHVFAQHPLTLLLQTVCKRKLPQDTEPVELRWLMFTFPLVREIAATKECSLHTHSF